MRLLKNISGIVRLKITSGDISGSLSAITAAGIILHEIVYDTDLCIIAMVTASDYWKICKLIDKRGDKCEVISKSGFVFFCRQLYRRTALIFGICLLIVLTIWIPRRIFFIQIEGNKTVNQKSILLSAQNNGVRFGCLRSELRSDEIKNKIIEDIPMLDWVGITTRGCVATVHVSEKQTYTELTEDDCIVSSIVATRDGIVDHVTATKGTVLCKPGSAVYEGQILISGYEDCGRILKGSNAQGEVYAKTFYVTEAISPREYQQRTEISETKSFWTLQIGKKFINFSKDSGISPTTCVKMYEERYLTLPGGFELPVCLIRQYVIEYDTQEEILSAESARWMSSAMETFIRNQMIAGDILSGRDYSECLDDIFYMSSRYACFEQIGIRKIEESWKEYGKDS